MAGTRKGGKLAARKIKENFGKDHFAKIGRKGGKRSKTGGFASLKVGPDGLTGPERARKLAQEQGERVRSGEQNTH